MNGSQNNHQGNTEIALPTIRDRFDVGKEMPAVGKETHGTQQSRHPVVGIVGLLALRLLEVKMALSLAAAARLRETPD